MSKTFKFKNEGERKFAEKNFAKSGNLDLAKVLSLGGKFANNEFDIKKREKIKESIHKQEKQNISENFKNFSKQKEGKNFSPAQARMVSEKKEGEEDAKKFSLRTLQYAAAQIEQQNARKNKKNKTAPKLSERAQGNQIKKFLEKYTNLGSLKTVQQQKKAEQKRLKKKKKKGKMGGSAGKTVAWIAALLGTTAAATA